MIVAGLASGIVFTLLVKFIFAHKETQAGVLAMPNLFLIPFIGGLVAALCWRGLYRTIGQTLLDALGASILALVAAALFLREGLICLLMVFPVFYLMMWAGILLGRWWFKRRNTKTQLSIFPLLVLLILADASYVTNAATVVTDEILIRAPPAKIWPHVLAFPQIPDPPAYWIFRIGLPYPTETTNGGDFIGADRRCIFSSGVVIRERVAEFVPEEKLTFDIIEQPTHPEAYGHITLHRGQFLLRDNHDGTTTLIGSSWYTLRVHPAWYFDLWARDMSHAVHLRVMNHIRRLAEADL